MTEHRGPSTESSDEAAVADGEETVSMDLVSLARLFVRRWWVTLPLLALTLVGVVAAATLSPPVYRSSGSIVLLNPPAAPDPNTLSPSSPVINAENPYARFNDLSVMVDIVARVMSSDSAEARLRELGVDDYEVAGNQTFSSGPLIEVTADAPSAEAAIRSAELVLAEVQVVLEDRQLSRGTDPRYLISFDTIEAPSRTTTVLGSTLRMAIAVLAIGGLFTFGLAMLADVVLGRRAARAAKRSSTGPKSPSPGSAASRATTPPINGASTSSHRSPQTAGSTRRRLRLRPQLPARN
ncbi:MAG: hypothetical protein ACRD0A_16260 [Acidimicrobiales bacterium]